MMMDSDSAYKPNGDYLMSPYGWHTPQDLQQFTNNAPIVYPYGDYGSVVVKSEYDDDVCGVGGGGDGGGGGIGIGGDLGCSGGGDGCGDIGVGGGGGGSSSSPGLEHDTVEPKKGIHIYTFT